MVQAEHSEGRILVLHSEKEIGIAQFSDYTFAQEKPLRLVSGKELSAINVRYECYGQLNLEKTNAILIIHALTGNHHAAGKYSEQDKYPGWWHAMIGPGKAFDTDRFFVVCSNNLGGCSGTTGPNSIHPATRKPYGMQFPMITVEDMVEVQKALMQKLKIPFFYAVAGGSMGGMLALHWSTHYPEKVKRAIVIATTAAQGAQSIAFSEVGRQAIMRDPDWQQGNYSMKKKLRKPTAGLAVARMLAHITYLSDHAMKQKFGRRRSKEGTFSFSFKPDFEVERYLGYQGSRFTDRFDANSYLYITKALNYFNLAEKFGSLEQAFTNAKSRYLVISFSSDWLYPSYLSKQLVEAMLKAGRETSYLEIESQAGHDAFLLEWRQQTKAIRAFLFAE